MRQDYSLSVNLSAYIDTEIIEHNGKKGIFIPIEGNSIFEGKDGALWQNLQAIEMNKMRYNTTHFVKRQVYKEDAAKMTDEEKKNQPILGYMKPLFFTKTKKV